MAKMLLVVAAAIIMLTSGIYAEKYTVGDEEGWTVPPSKDFYSSWAAKHSFDVDDTLVFNFSGVHTVAVVSKEGYENCEAGDAKAETKRTEITLMKTGPFYFICTVGDHCDSGQKLSITVGSAASADSPAIAPTPSGMSSSQSMSIMPLTYTFCFTFMAIVLAFLCY